MIYLVSLAVRLIFSAVLVGCSAFCARRLFCVNITGAKWNTGEYKHFSIALHIMLDIYSGPSSCKCKARRAQQ